MESYSEEYFDVRPKLPSAEALEKWKRLCGVVKNHKRRFRFAANLSKRPAVEAVLKACQAFRSESESELQPLRSESESESELQPLRSESEPESQALRSDWELQGWRLLSVFFLVMEAISVALDIYGRSKKNFLLVSFVLSAFGCTITICAFIRKRSTAAYQQRAERELAWVEVAFSVLQLVTLFIQYILAVARVKNSYSPSLFALVFALVVAVFALKKKQISHSQVPRAGLELSQLELGSVASKTSRA